MVEPKEGTADFIEPWRCEGPCQMFVYNTDKKGYPAPGAPVGVAIKPKDKTMRVCQVCAQMYVTVLSSDHFKSVHNKWLQDEEHKNRLKLGNNYLDKRD